MNNPILLVSTGRTGTKYFSNFFADYGAEVASYHTTRYTRIINILANMYNRGYISLSLLAVIWKRLKLKFIESHQKRYIECNPYYYNLVVTINDYFPKAKFVIIVRHPKTFIKSYIQWEHQRWKSLLANRLLPFWQPVSYWEHLMGFTNNYHQRVKFYSTIWTIKNDFLIRTLAGKDNAIMLRFEDTFNPESGAQVLTDLMKWLEIPLTKPVDQSAVTTKVNVSGSWKKEDLWDDRCTEIMLHNCGELMQLLGYETCE